MLEFFRDDSRKPLALYWLVLTVVVLDIFTGLMWKNMFSPFFADISHPGGGPLIVRIYFRWVLSIIFIVCMLCWANHGVLFSFIYIFAVKVYSYVMYFGMYLGISAINRSVEIPLYLILCEVFALVVLITYMVKKHAVERIVPDGRYDIVDSSGHYSVFDKVTGKCVYKGDSPTPLHGKNATIQRNIFHSDTYEADPGYKTISEVIDSVPMEYKIDNNPEGRLFIVRYPATGETETYQSVDEMPRIHYDVFVRMLREGGLW